MLRALLGLIYYGSSYLWTIKFDKAHGAAQRDHTHCASIYQTPALRKEREGRGTLCVGVSNIKSLGHPARN